MTFHFSDEGEERAQGGRIAQGGQISRLGFEAEDFSKLLAQFPRSYGCINCWSTATFNAEYGCIYWLEFRGGSTARSARFPRCTAELNAAQLSRSTDRCTAEQIGTDFEVCTAAFNAVRTDVRTAINSARFSRRKYGWFAVRFCCQFGTDFEELYG